MTDLRHHLERLASGFHATGPAGDTGVHGPGTGLLLGAAACVVFAAASLPLPGGPATSLFAGVASVAATAALTRAFGETGLARSADRLAGAGSPAYAGILALALTLGGKLALLAAMAGQSAAGVLAVLLAGHAVSRFWPLVLPYGAAPADRDASPARVGSVGLWAAGLWCMPALLLLAAVGGLGSVLLAALASTVAFAILVRTYRARLQRFQAEAQGATQQLCELAFLFGAAMALRAT